jgi:hypothetical protein
MPDPSLDSGIDYCPSEIKLCGFTRPGGEDLVIGIEIDECAPSSVERREHLGAVKAIGFDYLCT